MWNICPFFRVYEDKARLIWVTGLGNFGGENKNIVSPSPDQIYMYRLPVLILHPLETPPPQNVFSDWKIPFIAQKRLFVCTRSTRISMEYQCVNDSCLFEENPSEFLAQSNINACFKFKERKFNFIYWIGDFKSCMYILFEMGWFKDLSEELWGWKFGPKL